MPVGIAPPTPPKAKKAIPARPAAPSAASQRAHRGLPPANSLPRGLGPGTVETVQQQQSGGGGGGGPVDGGVGGALPMNEADYLGMDDTYLATVAAIDAALKMYEADNMAQRKKYDVDYDTSLRTLGYKKPVGKQGSPDFKPGDFDRTDLTTASGKAYQNQLGDFASRGLLQSSLYDRANSDLTNQLGRQFTSIETARTNFMDELDRVLAAERMGKTQERQQARMQALQSSANGLG